MLPIKCSIRGVNRLRWTMIITTYGELLQICKKKKMKTFFRDTVTTVELLLLRILEFKIPEADFFSYLVKFLYSLEKWCHGRQCEANQDIVKLFQAVSRSQGVTYSSNVSRPF